jgi:hypothetical protein
MGRAGVPVEDELDLLEALRIKMSREGYRAWRSF